MATCQDFLDDLNDLLNDAANTQIPQATKIRYLNRGLAATWPRLYRVVMDDSLYTVAGTYEYAMPPAVADEGRVVRLEVETAVTGGTVFRPIDNAFITAGVADRMLQFPYGLPGPAGKRMRITVALPLTAFTTTASVYDGPRGTEELAVWYALGLAESKRLDDRVDHTRYSTVAAQNGVDIGEVMNASQFAFAQFELLLDRMALPMPVSDAS